ncbi:redox-sensitive transcriptional activator SoxR [Ferrimonas senticii]|uniref:redox-sensitive transcriptional activator SoxR n=1 Tax=Ferrimonas senticii TaxID=394566 RepID=UPI00042526F7|nr:redox-sensitive transcriptional activator SoxR [Ferrimonas senticii]
MPNQSSSTLPNDGALMTISEVAQRCDIATSALRFYEQRGLIFSTRTSGNQRRYHSSMVRRISVIKVAQSLGLSLEQIAAALATLPKQRTPTQEDWQRLSQLWHDDLQQRIEQMQRLRDNLGGCIGCGCLSLKRCQLMNPDDSAAGAGAGPRYLLD